MLTRPQKAETTVHGCYQLVDLRGNGRYKRGLETHVSSLKLATSTHFQVTYLIII